MSVPMVQPIRGHLSQWWRRCCDVPVDGAADSAAPFSCRFPVGGGSSSAEEGVHGAGPGSRTVAFRRAGRARHRRWPSPSAASPGTRSPGPSPAASPRCWPCSRSPTPRCAARRVTTALLPAVGLPVLAARGRTARPPARPRRSSFLAVVGAGVYARRWGPRGHSLGVFAFMTFFVAQFLHAHPGQLPELYAAVVLSVLARRRRCASGCGATSAARPRPPCPPPPWPANAAWPAPPPVRPSRRRSPPASPWSSASWCPGTAGTGPSAPPGGSS